VWGSVHCPRKRRVMGAVGGAPMVGNKHPAATEASDDSPSDERAPKNARIDATVEAAPSASSRHAVPPQLRQHAARMLAAALATRTGATQPPPDVAQRVRTMSSQCAPGHRNRPATWLPSRDLLGAHLVGMAGSIRRRQRSCSLSPAAPPRSPQREPSTVNRPAPLQKP
jgi:hypothetical protein